MEDKITYRFGSDLKKRVENMELYFKLAEVDISRTNIRIFLALSIVSSISIVLISLITMLMLPGWGPSIYHKAFFICANISVLVAVFIYRCKSVKVIGQKIICSVFAILFALFLILIDTIPSPGNSQIFVGLFLVIAPVIFIIPPEEMVLYQLVSFIFFIIMTSAFKGIELVKTDILSTFIGFLTSFIVYGIVMNMRVEEFIQKQIYKKMSESDSLTGISNRHACKSRIEDLMLNRKNEEACAVLMMDADDFKNINDTLGHSMGDKVLIAIAGILKNIFCTTEVIGRYGGDEFIVFLTGNEAVNNIELRCHYIEEQMKKILDGRFGITCSIGGCVVKSGMADIEKMMRVADTALYESKAFKKGTSIIRQYDDESIKNVMPVMIIVDDIQIDREVMAFQFEDDFSIVKFDCGEKALGYIKDNYMDISIILLDMIMPGMSGEEVLKQLKADVHTGAIPVVVISADDSMEETALECGAADMIIKPIVPAVTRLRVFNAIGRAI
ncbi:MAG: diguanylate cyclase [Eubacteriales bacterium]|nr:diguanylate cyclase [Eubacteriales bacterium]